MKHGVMYANKLSRQQFFCEKNASAFGFAACHGAEAWPTMIKDG